MYACYSNPSPTFQPANRSIVSITNANPGEVTTSIEHDYLSGEIVRLKVPEGFGMTQANNLTGTITVTGDTTFEININTSSFDVFSEPSPLPSAYTCAQVIPVGEVSSTLAGATKNVLPSGER